MLRTIVFVSLLTSTTLLFAKDKKEISVATLPAVVVKTVPEAGSKNVDPGLRQIEVTFSKRMLDRNWSWATVSKELLLKIKGKPRYLDDGRTCVVNVELEPNRTYGTWLNIKRFRNFKDADGRPAVPYRLVFRTGPGSSK